MCRYCYTLRAKLRGMLRRFGQEHGLSAVRVRDYLR